MEKVKFELSPHDALAIASFLQEYRSDMDQPGCESLRDAVDNYQEEIYKMSMDQFDDAVAETRMYQLLGKAPSINKNGEEQ